MRDVGGGRARENVRQNVSASESSMECDVLVYPMLRQTEDNVEVNLRRVVDNSKLQAPNKQHGPATASQLTALHRRPHRCWGWAGADGI